GRTYVRALFFLPWAIPGLIVGLTWKWMYDGSAVGLLNMLVLRLGLSQELIQWLGNYDLALWAVVVAVVWASTPFWAMMFLAGLQAISGELYEAAQIDGADVYLGRLVQLARDRLESGQDRKSTRLNSSHVKITYAV